MPRATMADKTETMNRRLSALNDERDKLETAIEEMIANMAEALPHERAKGAWAQDGASTQRYLTLTNRLSEVETEIIELGRAMGAADKPPSVH
jgi:hypothetical protein